jgi:predicted transposase YbfD/YdcC
MKTKKVLELKMKVKTSLTTVSKVWGQKVKVKILVKNQLKQCKIKNRTNNKHTNFKVHNKIKINKKMDKTKLKLLRKLSWISSTNITKK